MLKSSTLLLTKKKKKKRDYSSFRSLCVLRKVKLGAEMQTKECPYFFMMASLAESNTFKINYLEKKHTEKV